MSGESVDTDESEGTVPADLDTDRAVRYLRWVGVVVLGITALVALAGFYTGVSSAIRVWIADDYRPLVNAAFNLALLLAALAGIGLILRRQS